MCQLKSCCGWAYEHGSESGSSHDWSQARGNGAGHGSNKLVDVATDRPVFSGGATIALGLQRRQ